MSRKPSTEQLKAYLLKMDRGRVKGPALDHAARTGMSADAVNDAVHRVRDRRASLEIQSAPARYARRNPKITLAQVGAPTPEWLARNKGHIETRQAGSDIREQGYRIKHVIESLADKLTIEQRSATERYMEDSQWHERVKIADWNGSGGGSGLTRLGGLGEVPQAVRDAHARFVWVKAHLNPLLVQVSDYMILRVAMMDERRPVSLEEFGRAIFPNVKDKRSLVCYATGTVKSFAEQLAWLYLQPGCPRVSKDTDEDRELNFNRKERV